MKNLRNQFKKVLKNERGDVLQFIVILVVIVAVSVAALPGLMNGITDKGTDAVSQLDNIDNLFTTPEQ